ncbi:MAG: hypothetical protein RMN53_17270 [Anaerolineae bacterium]|nr:hypothetical protein [Anaerolineae bacterium]
MPGPRPERRLPAAGKPDRWLIGLVAGLALLYLLGKAMGLGRPADR